MQPIPPTAAEVARRALVLAAAREKAEVALGGDLSRTRRLVELYEWSESSAIKDALSLDASSSSSSRPASGLGLRAIVRARQRFEGVPLLTWALGLTELPAHGERADGEAIAKLSLFEALPALVDGGKLRAESEIEELRARMAEVEAAPEKVEGDAEERRAARFERVVILGERRRVARWLLGVAPTYADASEPLGRITAYPTTA